MNDGELEKQLDAPLEGFRADLVVSPVDHGQRTLYKVYDPRSKGSFELDELEYKVARTLDGQRNAKQVSAQLRQGGLVVQPRHVLAFSRELRGLGFLSDQAPPVQDHRGDVVPFMMQANDYAASGRYELAVGLYEAVLELDPENEGAKHGLREAQARVNEAVAIPERSAPKRRMWLVSVGAGAAVLLAAAGFLLWSEGVAVSNAPATDDRRPPPAPANRPEATARPRPSLAASPTVEPPSTAAPSPRDGTGTHRGAGPSEEAITREHARPHRLPVVSRQPREQLGLPAPRDGVVLETHVRVGDRVSAGEPIATFAPWRGHPDRIAELRRRIVELRRLATQSKAYEGFLQSARKRLRALRRPGRSSALVAQQDGVLVELVDPPASVDSGDVIARTEAMTTMLEATGDGSLAELAFDAECSLDSGEGQSASCNVEGVEVTRGSTTVTVKAAVGPEPWVDDDPLWVVLDPPAAGPSPSQPSTKIQLSERLEPGTESEP